MDDPVPDQKSPPGGNDKRRRALTIIAVVFALAATSWLLYWYLVLSRRETTDDAYVGGNQVNISAQVAGTVLAVMADNTQLVQAGQPLVRLDPTDLTVALDQASAALAQTVRQIREQTATATQYDAAVDSRRFELQLAQADLDRRAPLLAQQAIAPEELKHAQNAVEVARALLIAAERQAAAAHAVADVGDIAQHPTVLQARAAYVQAAVAARRATVVAPVTGYVALRTVQLGQRVTPGLALMSVIPLGNLWIDANFKEGQLRHLRIGQPAAVSSDLYGGGVLFHGHIAGMSPGTGAAFALLPAQNASGNWIKVIQRVPVRIELDPQELARHPLRIGLSADVDVDTRDQSGTVLATSPASSAVSDTGVYAGDLAAAQAQADTIIRVSLERR
ncbi:MAG: efflux RND transporter periplasmic adaptor subunit [Steroidobacterales bacterium]